MQNFKKYFNNNPAIMLLIDSISGAIANSNIAAQKFYGYTQDEFLNLNIADLNILSKQEVLNEVKGFYLEKVRFKKYQHRLKNKEIKDIRVFGSPISIANHNYNFAVIEDITAERNAEKEIEDLNKRNQILLQSASDAICVINKSGDLLEVNNAFATMLGYSKNELLKFNVADFDCQLDKQEIQPLINKLICEPAMFNSKHVRADGSIIDVEINAVGVNLHGSDYLYASHRDITKWKIQNDQQIDYFKKIEKLTARILGVVYQYLLKPDGTSCFPYASNKLYDIYGVYPEEVKHDAAKVFKVIHPEDYDGVVESINQSACDLTIWEYEYRVCLPDTGTRWLHGSSVPEKLDDGSILWNGMIYDITDRVANDIKLKDFNASILRSNKDLENFAYIASHDLKEPINIISGILNLFNRNNLEITETEKNEMIQLAISATDRMKNLIASLLQYSRIGTNKEDFVQIDLNELISNLLIPMQESIEKNIATIVVHPLPLVKANKTLICELFINLIGNALKYHGPNAVKIEVGFTENQSEFTFFVKDNGIGIDPVNFEKIFLIFSRLHRKEEFEGTGIGLALCKRIVELHDGKIWVESALGKGSTFYFTVKK